MIINGHRAKVMVDTGATDAFIDPDAAKQFGLRITPVSGQIGLSGPIKATCIGRTEPTTVQTRKYTRELEFELLKIEGSDAYLGLHQLQYFGISLNGLDYAWPDEPVGQTELDPIVPTKEKEDCSALNQRQKQIFDATIAAALERNQTIDIREHCQLPEAEINIDTPPGKVSWRPQYKIPERYKPHVDELVKYWEDNCIIGRGGIDTQWNIPIMAAPPRPPSDKPRICVDPRGVNEMSQDDRYPIPDPAELFERLRGAVIFSSLDAKHAFHTFPIAKKDQHKTSFTWRGRIYQWL